MKQQLPQWVQQITSDKKKLGIMICAMAIGLLLWGRLLLQGVPRTATADEKQKTAQADVSPDKNTGKATQSAKPVAVVHVDIPAHPGRDPFGLDPSRYRRTPGSQTDKTAPKSAQITPDEDPQMALVRQEAMELRLESVVTGTRPRAYINGTLLAPGDNYEGFVLIQVTDRHVLLTKYGLIIKLRM